MNKITIILKESGTIAELKKNFNIYQNSSQNVLLNILVPKSIIEGKFSAQYTNQSGQTVENGVYTAVKIGMTYINSNGTIGKSENYYVRYLKEIKSSEGDFFVYERIMPSVFTRVSGVGLSAPEMVINVVNLLNSSTQLTDGTTSEDPTVLTLITTQKCKIDIEPSTNLDIDPEIDATELELLEGQVNDLIAETANKVDKEYAVQKYNILEALPEEIHYEKDGFKTKGVHFYNESFTVPISDVGTATKVGEIYVTGVRQHETEIYWILQDEIFNYDTGIAKRTLTINAVQASINQYTTMDVGDWQLVNQDYINSIKSQADQNSEDIEVLYRLNNTGTNYLGEYPSQSTLPTDDDLDEFVEENFSRAPQNGDELTFVQTVEDATDVVYMIRYSEVNSTWTETPLPSVEPAKNGSMGIVKGTGEDNITESKKVLVDINNGEIEDIYHQNESNEKESVSTHLNRNSQAIETNSANIAELDENLEAEVERAQSAEQTNATAISNEVSRATQAESELESDLEAEVGRATAAEQANSSAITAETSRATQAEENLDTDKLDKTNINAYYLKNIVFSINGDNGVATLELNNPVTGQTQSIEITVTTPASSTNTGLMTSDMVQALNGAIEDIQSLKYVGKQIASFPTYADAELFDFSTIPNIQVNDYFIVQSDESRTEPTEKDQTTKYICIDDTTPITIDSFQFQSVVTTVNIQVATETQLGGVLSTNANGYVYVENNGLMKLVGYDSLVTAINNLASAISAEQTRAEGAETTLSQAITAESNRAQQAEQANATAISSEASRAQAAEQNLSSTKADKTEIPTKTSDLENDSGFITEEGIPSATSDLTNDGDGTLISGVADPYAKVSQIPTNNNQLANGAGYTKATTDTKINWETNNSILTAGEVGIESDTGKKKIGDGNTTWNNLKPVVEDNDWVTIYDMSSADAAINIGYTSGIIASTGLLSDMADLNPYSYLKIYYHANKNYYVQIFELTEVTKTDRAGYCLNLINNEVTGIIAQGLFLELDDAGAKRLRVANGRYIQMVSSKVWTISSLSSDNYPDNYYITKILAK